MVSVSNGPVLVLVSVSVSNDEVSVLVLDYEAETPSLVITFILTPLNLRRMDGGLTGQYAKC